MKPVLCRLVLAPLLCLALPGAAASTAPLAYADQALSVNGQSVTARVPAGYRLELLTTALDGPRLLTFSAEGDLFIGSKSGNVYRLSPPYTRPEVLVRLDGYPHSVAFRAGSILIARTDGLYHAPYQPGQARLARNAVRLLAPLPGGGGHNSRSVAVGPDQRIYLGLGITGNCSNEYLDEAYSFGNRRGGVLVLDEKDGAAHWQPFASGLRNPVGFAWHPVTGALYASNNGPDHHGYEQPPEYFSRVDPGSFHGMPWFQFDGTRVRPDDCIDAPAPRPLAEVVEPAITFPARNAPMGVAFVPKGAMDERLESDAIVALHGSWATLPQGSYSGDAATRRPPAIVAVRFEDGRPRRVDKLVSGFQLQDGGRWARPVGVALGPDGALYFTSDGGTHGLFRLRPEP